MKKFEDALEILNKVENLEKQEELINLKKQIIIKKEEIAVFVVELEYVNQG